MRLRIAVAAPLWVRVPPANYGGVELVVKHLCDGLVARGHEVTLFSSADCETSARPFAVMEKPFKDLMTLGRAYSHEYYVNSMVAELFQKQDQFDIIHFHCSPAWMPITTLLKSASLFTMHTAPYEDDEWVLRRWPSVVLNGISRSQIQPLSSALGRDFPVIYNGCDFSAFQPRYEKGRHLAFLGRMGPNKNPSGAIEIAKACGLPIVLAGEPLNWEEHAYFEAEVRPQLDGERIRWIGPLNHVQKEALLQNAIALLFPIKWDEPFGLVMLEAMACGTPVVACKRGSVAEVIDQGITGFYAETAEELPSLVESAQALSRQRLRLHAAGRFDVEEMTSAYERLYIAILAERQ